MAVDNTAKSNGRASKVTSQRSRAARATKATAEAVAPIAEPVESDDPKPSGEAASSEAANSDPVVAPATATTTQAKEMETKAAIELHQPSEIATGLPAMSSDIEVAETMSVAGIRPIAVSHLELAGSFLNGRPIEASHLKVHEMLPGGRPVFESEFKMVEGGALLPNDRPIAVSNPELLHGSGLPGNRPIASNEIVDPEPTALMGYLD